MSVPFIGEDEASALVLSAQPRDPLLPHSHRGASLGPGQGEDLGSKGIFKKPYESRQRPLRNG